MTLAPLKAGKPGLIAVSDKSVRFYLIQMTVDDLYARVREDAQAKKQRLETARTGNDKLTDEECLLIYLELESRLARSMRRVGADTLLVRPSPKGKARTKNAKASKVKYTDRVVQVLGENPHGLRSREVASKIGQASASAHVTLTLLERTGRIERHGQRRNTLWTLPGVTPVARTETIANAYVHVLGRAPEPMDARELQDAALKLVALATGKKPRSASMVTELSRLVSKGIVARVGANEHGPLYVLRQKGQEGGNEESTLN